MQAANFYKSAAKNALKLKLVTQDLWKKNNLPQNAITQAHATGFKAKLGELVYFHDSEGKLKQIFIGAGDNEFEAALAIAACNCPQNDYYLEQEVSARAILMWALAQYKFTKYKKNPEKPRCLCLDKNTLKNSIIAADALFLVRDLINTPAEDMGPLELAKTAHALAKEFGAKCNVISGDDLLAKNFPAIHAVGRASSMPPCLIELAFGKKNHPLIAIVGKGVCFDSGGLDLKDAKSMRLMKKDMGGAAHALGLAKWIMALNLPIRIKVLIAAAENAIGANAYRPGDVVTMRNKLTVEIENTDAEGRMVMADALVKACEDKPDLIIDLATLTGAARVAVGTEIAAFFTNDEKLAASLQKSSDITKDPLWRLPLFKDYSSMLASSIADLVNASSTGYAGAITAALFLQRFIQKNLSWVHFDMMAWNLKSKPGKPEGGEAMALCALMHYLNEHYTKRE
ncbi:MAG: leucyl aminopeptidase [Legionellales bacterium RIFCSPHIGHO2_12_FULL_37_14]|nr:MAG: leucyl aminopeptidase [Legionellales bacterium RIFCSPHIGHO2_12_FULL_37_14]